MTARADVQQRSAWLCGILIGGRARRFGGIPKGLLRAPHRQPIVVQLAAAFRSIQPEGEVVLLGRNPAYEELGLVMLQDAGAGLGPIGGLLSLLRHGAARNANALLLGCDLPNLTRRTLYHLTRHFKPPATSLHHAGVWQPMVSLYDSQACLTAIQRRVEARQLGLGSALEALGAHAVRLEASDADELHDWDCPNDLR